MRTLLLIACLLLAFAAPGGAQEEEKALKIDTTLVTVPIIATDKNGNYIPDLQQSELTVSDNGVKQEIAVFATVKSPFQVALLIDTSASTEEKLFQIQSAAKSFVDQLQSGDRIKVIAFDDEVYELSGFTNDRGELKKAIEQTRPGQGTKLYDAIQLALNALKRTEGRKAIVIFTDGVDMRSDGATFEGTLNTIEESGVIIYPIRFETRAEVERLVRQQQQSGQPVDPSIIFGRKIPGISVPTIPGGRPPVGQQPLPRVPTVPPPTIGNPPRPNNDPQSSPFPDDGLGQQPTIRNTDNVGIYLDTLYKMADSYLNAMAEKSGGRLYRADTLGALPEAFARIAAELRTQYLVGYYPSDTKRDGKYRKIKVKVERKNVSVRHRPGYRAPKGG